MRYVRNLLWLIVGFLLAAVSCFAFAAYEVGAPTGYLHNRCGNVIGTFASPDPSKFANEATDVGACTTTAQQMTCTLITKSSGGTTQCAVIQKQCTGAYSGLYTVNGTNTGQFTECYKPVSTCSATQIEDNGLCRNCPANSTKQGNQCVCSAGLVMEGGQCVVEKCTDRTPGATGFLPLSQTMGTACMGGCAATFKGTNGACPTHTAVINGKQTLMCKGAWVPDGNGNSDKCTEGGETPAAPSTSPELKDSCGAGQGMIKVDGVTRCINSSTGQEVSTANPTTETKNTEKTTVTDPVTGKTTTTTTITNVTTGGTTTITNVYGPGVDPNSSTATPISTTVSTTGGGASGESNTKPGTSEGNSDKDACEDDPQRVGCKHWEELVGTVPDAAPKSEETQGVNFAPVAGFGSGSYSCPQAATVNHAGHSFTMSNTPVCDLASRIQPLVIALALFAAAYIAFSGGKD